MNIATTNIHFVEKVDTLPVKELFKMDGQRYDPPQYKQKVEVITEDGSEHTFTMFFADAVNKRIDRERNSVNNTVVGQL